MNRLSQLFSRRRLYADLSAEIEEHLHERIDELVAVGMSYEDAARTARRGFGNVTLLAERSREVWQWPAIESFFADIRFALRMLRKSPGFTAIAVLTLALGIGANTAIFSVVYAVLLRPLPYAHPDQLVRVAEAEATAPAEMIGLSYPDFVECRKQNSVFSEMAGSQFHDLTLTGAGEPATVGAVTATPLIFSLLRAKPLAGRIFLPEDGKQSAAPVVLLSENLWRSRFAGNPNLIGQSINLDKRAFTVVGIMPASFRFPPQEPDEDVWIPLVQDPLFGSWMWRPGGHWLRVIARLKEGVSIAQAQAEMDTVSARLAKQFPAENSGWLLRLEPLQREVVRSVRAPLLVLLGAVALVLLIACANIANLLLSRATTRGREFAVRMALGAGHGRIARQLLAECAVLGLLGGTAGVFLAYWGVQSLRSLLPPNLPQLHAVRVDAWVLLFALLLSVAATLIFGLAPSLFAADSNLPANLKEGAGRAGEGVSHQRLQRFLAAAQISLAMVLLVAAGLLIRSFVHLTSVNPGFDAQRILKAEISLPQFQYSKPQQWTAFTSALLAKIQNQPGMQNSALAVPLPLSDGFVNLAFDIVGNPPLPPGTSLTADYVSVSPEYFRVMKIPLLRGRFFNGQDSASAPRVAIISQILAQRYFPNRDPLGRRLVFGLPPDGNVSREIVGVVGDVRDMALNEKPGPMMYVPFAQAPFWGSEVVVRSSLDSSSVAAAIRSATHSLDKDLPITGIESLPHALSSTVAQPRFRTFLLGLFGAIALLLAAVGIFGVISYSVSRRTHELGVRMALGAQPGDILSMVLRETFALTLSGIAVGLPCALAAMRLATHMLFDVRPYDPLTLVLGSLALVAVGALAGYIPARRAMKVDPMVALRYE